jgi:hypothetical protein
MNPLKQLKGMMATKEPVQTGQVIEVSAGVVKVRGRSSLKSFAIPNASAFTVGETVRYQGNVLLGKSVPVDSLPVFTV